MRSALRSYLADCYSIICFCGPHSRKEYQWKLKERNYIEQLKQLQNTVTELVQQLNSLEEYHQHEKVAWHAEKCGLLERLDEIQDALHQKEVVTQQYRVYEDSFRKERQQIQELLATLAGLERSNEEYRREVAKLNRHVDNYRCVVDALRRKAGGGAEEEHPEKIFTIEEEFVRATARAK